MYYYLVEKIGDGTRENPFRPNVKGAYVWGAYNVCPNCNTYIVALSNEDNTLQKITDLTNACEARGLNPADVEAWFIGE